MQSLERFFKNKGDERVSASYRSDSGLFSRPSRSRFRDRPAAVDIRAARPDDVATLARLQVENAAFAFGLALDEACVASGVRRAMLLNAAHADVFVVDAHGVTVAGFMLTTEWSDWRDGVILWLQSFAVRQNVRAQRGAIFACVFRWVEARALADADVVGVRFTVDPAVEAAMPAAVRLDLCHSRGLELEEYYLMRYDKVPIPIVALVGPA